MSLFLAGGKGKRECLLGKKWVCFDRLAVFLRDTSCVLLLDLKLKLLSTIDEILLNTVLEHRIIDVPLV